MEMPVFQTGLKVHFLKTSEMYPNIKVLLTILATLPVTTCSAERSFCSLKRTKTSIPSSMTTTRLTNLTLLLVIRDIEVVLQSAIDEFACRHPRRLQMSHALSY
uniref:HAT C-terminal dimerisation domain-containing protein n=1 Tax=Amphimedon queenslandica TaxID=400682 RepID=A0A1X7T9Q1_AMPQE